MFAPPGAVRRPLDHRLPPDLPPGGGSPRPCVRPTNSHTPGTASGTSCGARSRDSTWHIWLEPLVPRALEAGDARRRGARRDPRLGRRPLRARCCRRAPRPCSARACRSSSSRRATRPQRPAPGAAAPGAAIAAGDASTRAHVRPVRHRRRATGSPTPPRSPSPRCPGSPTTRSSSAGRPGSARPTCCTRSPTTSRDHGGGLTVRYTTAEAFTDHFVGALHERRDRGLQGAPTATSTSCSSTTSSSSQSKARTEQEFFHTFNALHGAGAQLVLTSDRLPRDIDALEDRLRERFESGLVTDVRPPDADTRLTILRKRAQQDELARRRRRRARADRRRASTRTSARSRAR